MGIPPGYYTYQGKCAQTLTKAGGIGPLAFLFDGDHLISAKSKCKIGGVDFISAGYYDAHTTCIDLATGKKTKEVYTLYPDQTGRDRIKLVGLRVNGKKTSGGNPDWFHLRKKP